MSEKMAKGAVVNGYLKFVKKKWGIEGMQEAMKYAGINKLPKDGEWFPADATTKVLKWIEENKGLNYVVEAGRHASKDLGVFRYIVASFMSVERFLKRSRETYSLLFNYGEFLIDHTNNGAIITIKNARHPEPSCYAWEGALRGILEITRTKGSVERIDPDNPEDCKFRMTWE